MVTFKMYEKMNEIDRKNRLDKPTEVRVEVVLSFEFDMSDGVVL